MLCFSGIVHPVIVVHVVVHEATARQIAMNLCMDSQISQRIAEILSDLGDPLIFRLMHLLIKTVKKVTKMCPEVLRVPRIYTNSRILMRRLV